MIFSVETPIPEPLRLRMLDGDQGPGWNPENKVIRVTTLIEPAWLKNLEYKHSDDIKYTPHQAMMSTLGTAFHHYMETVDSTNIEGHHEVEPTVFGNISGWLVRGHVDWIDASGLLRDYKVTTAYKIEKGDFLNWERQLNIYAYLANQVPILPTVDRLEVFAVLRDWSPAKARASGSYPSHNHATIPLSLWEPEETEEYILERLKQFQDPKPCTAEERWQTPTMIRVLKKGVTRALKRTRTKEEAVKWVADNQVLGQVSFEKVVGEARRCALYCPVAKWCKERGPVDE